MICKVWRLRPTANAILERSSAIKAMSAASWGDVGAAQAHGDADIGHGERGGASFTPVADHGPTPPRRPICRNDSMCAAFCPGNTSALTSSRPNLPAMCMANARIIAREHDDFLDAEIAQVADRLIGPSAQRIGDANCAADLAVVGDKRRLCGLRRDGSPMWVWSASLIAIN